MGERISPPDVPREELFNRTLKLSAFQLRDMFFQLMGWMRDDPVFLRGWSVCLYYAEKDGKR
ncbi:MAG: hypothetical protein JWN74_2300 [Acidobacteriaceae bacterium]|nr:hypothetical protein [Acidobacteriaceae bacterium]